MITGEYVNTDGKTKEFAVEESSDTNLILGSRKSAFTVLRSSYKDASGNTQYEFWVKCLRDYYRSGYEDVCGMIVNGKSYRGLNRYGVFYSSIKRQVYPSRVDGVPYGKIVFDSRRTALVNQFISTSTYSEKYVSGWFEQYIYYRDGDREGNTVGNWTHIGASNYEYPYGPSSDGQFATNGNADLFGYLLNTGEVTGTMFASSLEHSYELLREIVKRDFEILWSGKIAEIRNWEIISNTTPEQNTFYLAILDKKGELLDVKTTTEFGITVGELLGEYSDKFSDEVKSQRIVDDWVVRMK